jgi:hypothetical protein
LRGEVDEVGTAEAIDDLLGDLIPVLGLVVAIATALPATWLSQRAQARAGQMAHEVALREDLYRDFIIAASKAYGDALLNSEPQLPNFHNMPQLGRRWGYPYGRALIALSTLLPILWFKGRGW